MMPILYDGMDPILCNGRALYELIQCVKGQPNNHAQGCHGGMQCFLSTVLFTLLSNNLSPTLCVANKLLASDNPHKCNQLTLFIYL